MQSSNASPEKVRLLQLALERERRRTSPWNTYSPYDKQARFHANGADHRERLLRAGNQQGKSFAGGMEMAYHVTGKYPDWWQGRRFDRPVLAWAAGDTGEATRDNAQRILLGKVGEFGTGVIPRYLCKQPRPAMGVADLFDYVKVKHYSGGWSTLRFKHYSQGRAKWQGPSVDVIWCDEEPPEDIYSEALARTIATGGMVYVTFTPLLGMSEVVRRFLMEPSQDRSDTNLTLEEAKHIAPEQRQRVLDGFLPHEREARANGTPLLGSGRVFPISEASITYEPMRYPKEWAALVAWDFGWDHPAAAVLIRHDRDSDVVYVCEAYRASETPIAIQASAVRPWGKIPHAWPHDGMQHDKASGKRLAELYREQGLDMLPEHAQWPEGGYGFEAGILEMIERMESGRLKVASHLSEWFDEFRLYHREKGLVVKIHDDLLSATRVGLMALRFAKVQQQQPQTFRPQMAGGWLGA